MFEDEIDYSDVLWKATPNLRIAMKSGAVSSLGFLWTWGILWGVINFMVYRWYTLHEYILVWLKLQLFFSVIFPVIGMLFSIWYYRYEYFITDRGFCIRKGNKMFFYA